MWSPFKRKPELSFVQRSVIIGRIEGKLASDGRINQALVTRVNADHKARRCLTEYLNRKEVILKRLGPNDHPMLAYVYDDRMVELALQLAPHIARVMYQ